MLKVDFFIASLKADTREGALQSKILHYIKTVNRKLFEQI